MSVQFISLGLGLFAILSGVIELSLAVKRVYYIGAIEELWDYAPSGKNLVNGKLLDVDSDASVFTKKGKERIGKIYKKALYREYTDNTFKSQKSHPKHLGVIGPIIRGQAGDILVIHFKNMAYRNYSMHPHGVFYDKASEGALYVDNTSGKKKSDDHVPPNGTHTYTWHINEKVTPADGDPNCLTWLYHSHVDPIEDINSGLIGVLLTCKKNMLDAQGKRTDVDKDFFLYWNVLDENKSWYLDDNLRKNGDDPSKVNKNDDAFKESNLMHSINGRFYGNLEGLDVCIGDKVSWHLSGLGNEVDLHTAYFHGHTIIVDHHRTDVENLFPARAVTAVMDVKNPGIWMLSCQVADHYTSGMIAFYNALASCSKRPVNAITSTGKIREYFISAEEIEWDYGPSQKNLFDGGMLNEPGSSSATFFSRGPNRIGGKYIKAVYKQYTGANFTDEIVKDKHLGLLGPVIKAEVGDIIRVVFKNKASYNFSIQPHGVFYNKSNEGALYLDGTSGALKRDDGIPLNHQYTYQWYVPDFVAPTDKDTPCIAWFYSSAVNPVKDVYSGLIGPLITCKKGSLQANGIPKSYDKEKFLYFAVNDENKSWYLDRNMKKFCTVPNCKGVSKEDEGFMESNKMHQINGYMYGNPQEGISICKDEKVMWHAIGMGNEVDMHSIYFHGNTFDLDGNHKDTVSILPGTFTTFTMTPDNVGKWALVCRTNDHYSAGMKTTYTVDDSTTNNKCKKLSNAPTGTKRTYYIAAVERNWDYAPSGNDLIQGFKLDQAGRESKTFAEHSATRIGKVYKKALYREYTDATFTKEKIRSDREKHLGVLGPIIKAEEGDELVVVFKNMASRKYSLHPHGVLYNKKNEGALYKDGTNNTIDDGINPNAIYTYHWFVPARASPGKSDTNCITWAYYSAVDPIKDTNTGLIGPLVTCRKGTLNPKGVRKDIDREFALLFTVLDENESWLLQDNIKTYTTGVVKTADEDFKESNKMHGINGYIYGNIKNLDMNNGETVDWYLIGMGNEVDMHTVHFHGQTFIHRTNSKHREDVYDLFPGLFTTLEMKPSNPGTWLLHCHVSDHMAAGMEALFTIRDPVDNSSTVKPASFSCAGKPGAKPDATTIKYTDPADSRYWYECLGGLARRYKCFLAGQQFCVNLQFCRTGDCSSGNVGNGDFCSGKPGMKPDGTTLKYASPDAIKCSTWIECRRGVYKEYKCFQHGYIFRQSLQFCVKGHCPS